MLTFVWGGDDRLRCMVKGIDTPWVARCALCGSGNRPTCRANGLCESSHLSMALWPPRGEAWPKLHIVDFEVGAMYKKM